ncbi:GNAT family N-acetyltransferase [Amylibacter sp. IMCC11727]|uniref:GNAT family N-acetyltransferase n=1 Tax=Amylibacter sp. IMCC11727 TaxID=3039851 RepID=UPI00244E1383|nr:GNAT family N-acetyltransferase [Amylibacter sp. IMCC11727]WGI20301.1 GNAT family N-acetyltransferase [Amylibacter sp. IMCC11727]
MMQSEITGQLVIPTARFSLRPVRNSDAGMINLFGEDKRLARMTTHIPHPLPPGATEAFLDRVTKEDSDEKLWSIDGSASGMGELLGMISLKKVTEDQSEISYWVAPNLWNSGLASEAVQALILANPLGDKSMVASVFQDNPASAKIVTNMGFQLIGESEVFSVARNGMVNTWDYVLRLPE